MNERELKGQELASGVKRIDECSYEVKSQTNGNYYQVQRTELGFNCSCGDHVYRGVKCKHIWAVEISFTLHEAVKEKIIIQQLDINKCPKCASDNIVRHGIRHNKYGNLQRFSCKSCTKRFSVNIGFEKMKHNPQGITTGMQLYFSGESLRNTAESLGLIGMNVSHQTILNWIKKYISLMERYLEQIKPKVSDAWRTDELHLKVKGNMKYLYALMDDETRFWIAQQVADTKYTSNIQPLFKKAKAITGKRPNVIISDGAANFHDAFNKEFWTRENPGTKHIQHIRLQGDHNNNKMERLNGEVRDREKVMRGLKRRDTSILSGYQLFHNYVRPHEALEGKTPAEVAGIKIEGNNKWKTLRMQQEALRREILKTKI